jgi:hypothetical protein
MSDLSAMVKEIDHARERMWLWLNEQNFSTCDLPGCLHPLCRGRTVEQRKASGQMLELAERPR